MRKKTSYQSRGLGDTISKITEVTGLEKLVRDDCGCEERKEKLNKIFSYNLKVVNCPTIENEKWFNSINTELSNEDRKELCKIYANVFNLPYFEPCINCSTKPYIHMYESLKKVFEK